MDEGEGGCQSGRKVRGGGREKGYGKRERNRGGGEEEAGRKVEIG